MRLTILVLCIMALCASFAMAQSESLITNKLSASADYFYFADSDLRDAFGEGYGLTLDYKLDDFVQKPISVSLGYATFSDVLDLTVMPLFVNWNHAVPNTKFFCGAGLGYSYMKAEAVVSTVVVSDTSYEFAWQVKAGMNFTEKMFGQLKYVDINGDGMATLSVGAKF